MNEGETELLVAVARVVAAFESLGVDYLIGGSVASSVFGEPRQTVDADLVARLLGWHGAARFLQRLLAAVRKAVLLAARQHRAAKLQPKSAAR